MTTYSSQSDTIMCDKCGRPIHSGKGYLIISGWIICGICQYEDEIKNRLNTTIPQSNFVDKLTNK
jgi:hypothetical protein